MRRFIIALIIFVVAMALGVTGVFWYVRRTHKAPPPITVPQYAEAEGNGFDDLAKAAEPLEQDGNAIADALDLRWNEENGRIRAVLEAHAADLQAARAALARECLQPRPTSIEQDFPYLKHLRTLARLLIVQGREHERDGRQDEAADCYLDALKLAPISARNGLLIHGLCGIAITQMVSPELARCLGSGQVTEAKLEEVGKALDEIRAAVPPFHKILAMEWAFSDQALADMKAGKPRAGGSGQAMGGPVAWFLFDRARSEVKEKLGKAIEDAKKPYWQRTYQMPQPKTMMGGIMLPVLGGAGRKFAEQDTVLLGVRTQVAIELYRQQRGSLPTALGDLVPAYLSELPLDPFDGKPLRYQQTDGGYVLYSVGPDGSDGGGKERLERKTETGDIIIWPWGPVMKPKSDRG